MSQALRARRQADLINSHLLQRPEIECAIETCTQFAGGKSASSDLPHAAFTDPRPSSLHPSTAQRCDRTQAGSLSIARHWNWEKWKWTWGSRDRDEVDKKRT